MNIEWKRVTNSSRSSNDCVIKAISRASGYSYEDLMEIALHLGEKPLSNGVSFSGVNTLARWTGFKLLKKNIKYLKDWEKKEGVYIVDTYFKCPKKGENMYHLSCIKDNVLYDTWDCRDNKIKNIWEQKEDQRPVPVWIALNKEKTRVKNYYRTSTKPVKLRDGWIFMPKNSSKGPLRNFNVWKMPGYEENDVVIVETLLNGYKNYTVWRDTSKYIVKVKTDVGMLREAKKAGLEERSKTAVSLPKDTLYIKQLKKRSVLENIDFSAYNAILY